MDRVKIFQIAILITATAIVARLFYWQFISPVGGEGNLQGEEQNFVPAPRGEIYTSDNFPLVANQEAFLVWANPNVLKKPPQDIAKLLAPHLISEKYATASAKLSEDEESKKKEEIKSKEDDLVKKLSNKNLFWVQLARKIPKETKDKLEKELVEGLNFERDDKRYYPEASMAAHTLGFVASDKFGQDLGYFGLEGYFERQLKGTPGRSSGLIDPRGFPILVGKYKATEPKKGASIYLTIDRAIQYIVEDRLRQAVQRYGAKDGTVIVADPKTGKILAMATYPTYNPSLFAEFDQSKYKNPAAAETYEPGSTFKTVVMASALNESVLEPTTKCDVCSGPRPIGGFEISTWNKKYFPNSTMTEVIEHSDNVGMTFVADKLGDDKFSNYLDKFGFGKKTNIELQEESDGQIRQKGDWRQIDLATASFGQGIAVTPIQMVQAVSTIANGGQLTPPTLVEKIVENGQDKKVKPKDQRQVITTKTAAQITEMMVSAVEKGEARVFAPKGYRIAGKTGTAQIPVAGHYDPNKTIASFVGFAPANDPKFVMLVKFTEPTSSPFGSETAAPTFFAISKEIFSYFGISPN